jgi:hypothetical protein
MDRVVGRTSGGHSTFASRLDDCHSGSRLLKVASCITDTPGHMILTDFRNAALAVL